MKTASCIPGTANVGCTQSRMTELVRRPDTIRQLDQHLVHDDRITR